LKGIASGLFYCSDSLYYLNKSIKEKGFIDIYNTVSGISQHFIDLNSTSPIGLYVGKELNYFTFLFSTKEIIKFKGK
jgi:hypothetical protein